MRRRTAAMVLLAGVGLLALPACGSKTDETVRAAGITPRDALAFFSVNLAPSIEQQRNLQSIVRKFPGAPEEIRGDFEAARDDLLDMISEEAGLDYTTDVEPWLGNEVAVALLKVGTTTSIFDLEEAPAALMFETSDPAAATAAVEKSAAAGTFDGQSRIVDDFLVVAGAADEALATAILDKVAAAAADDGGGLAGDDRFTAVVDGLAGDRLLLAWADGAAFAREFGALEGAGAFPFGMLPGLSETSTVAADVHAERSALVLRGVATATGDASGGAPELTAGLPADVIGAVTLFDVGSGVARAARAFAGLGGPGLDDLTGGFGIDLETDVLSWMKGELVVVAGPVQAGLPYPDFALVVEPTDRARAEAGVTKIAGLLEAQGLPTLRREVAGVSAYVAPAEFVAGVQPAMALFADRFVLASNLDFLERLAEDASPDLSGSDAYTSVIGDGSSADTAFQLVVRITPIREAIEQTLSGRDRAEYMAEVQPNVQPLDTFGMFARREGDTDRFEMRLTFR